MSWPVWWVSKNPNDSRWRCAYIAFRRSYSTASESRPASQRRNSISTPLITPAATTSAAKVKSSRSERAAEETVSITRPVRYGTVRPAAWAPTASSVEAITWPLYGRRKPSSRRNVTRSG